MKNLKVGIQLFSLRDELEKNFEGTLKKVAELGYKYVEFAGFYQRSATEVKAILDKYKLKAISAHQSLDGFNTPEKMQSFLKYIKELEIRFVVIPCMEKSVFCNPDSYNQLVQTIIDAGKIFAEHNITFCYHNHEFEFEKLDGQYILDRLYADVPETYLQPQLDLCWVNYSGESPIKYIEKYANRMHIIHFKDFYVNGLKAQVCDDKKVSNFKFTSLGQGIQKWEQIIPAVQKSDVEYVIYEKDSWYNGDPFEDAKQSRLYLKNNFEI